MLTLYTRPGCHHCQSTKALLRQHDIKFEEWIVGVDDPDPDGNGISVEDLRERFPHRHQLPIVVFADGTVGGHQEAAVHVYTR